MIYQGREYSDYDVEQKKIFLKNFRKLVGERTTAKEIVPMLKHKVKQSTISNWISDNPVCPSKKNEDLIKEIFNCDHDYLYSDDSEDFNNMYEKISQITGLSSKSIAVLESIHKRGTQDGRISGSGIEDYSHTTIDLINTVLEDSYDTVVKDENKPVHTVFQDMYNAISFQDLDCSEVDTPVDPFGGKPIKQLFTLEVTPEPAKHIKNVKYTDSSSKLGEIVSVRDLFHTFCQNRVIEWITEQRKRSAKNKTANV